MPTSCTAPLAVRDRSTRLAAAAARQVRCRAGCATVAALVALVAPVAVQADVQAMSVSAADAGTWQVTRSVTTTALQVERQSGTYLADGPPVRQADGSTAPWQQVMVWQPRGHHELGWGVALPASGYGVGGGLLVVGAGRHLTPNLAMRMGMSVPLGSAGPVWSTRWADGGNEALGSTTNSQVRFGLTLATRRPFDDLRKGLQLRMELSSSTTLAIKPRRSRMLVELHTKW